MSRGRTLVPLALSLFILTACGGGRSGSSAPDESRATLVTAGMSPPAGCYLTVFLIEDVTSKQILQVQRQLLANPQVTQISFVSRALALRRFAQAHPATAKGFVYNPFADQFEVVPRTNGGMFAIIAHFATHGGPITNVKPSSPCGQPS